MLIISSVGRRILDYARAARLMRALKRAGVPHALGIHTYTTRDELTALMQLAAECPPNARILEIGSYLGASTCFLWAGVAERGGRIWCVDTWQNETMPGGLRDTLAEFRANTARFRNAIVEVRKRSDGLVPADVCPPYDLVFIDGDHSYEAVKHDLACAMQWLAPTGVIALHDTAEFSGPSRALGEALASGHYKLSGHVGNLSWIRRALKWADARS